MCKIITNLTYFWESCCTGHCETHQFTIRVMFCSWMRRVIDSKPTDRGDAERRARSRLRQTARYCGVPAHVKAAGTPRETVGEGRNKHSSLKKTKARGKKPSRHPRLARLALQHSKLASPVKKKERKSDGPGLGIANRPPPSSLLFLFFSFSAAKQPACRILPCGATSKEKGVGGKNLQQG